MLLNVMNILDLLNVRPCFSLVLGVCFHIGLDFQNASRCPFLSVVTFSYACVCIMSVFQVCVLLAVIAPLPPSALPLFYSFTVHAHSLRLLTLRSERPG